MRTLLPTTLAIALSMTATSAHADEQLAAALEGAGFFTGFDRAQTAALRAEVVNQGYLAALRGARRVAPANTVTFAAGGVGAWVRNDVGPILAMRGVMFRPAEDRLALDGSAYSVVIGTNEYPMWRAGETNTELAATVAAFGMVNPLLESIGAPERLYLISQGASGQAWLLTPAQAQIIRGVTPPDSWPYLPGLEALPAAVVLATPAADAPAPTTATAIPVSAATQPAPEAAAVPLTQVAAPVVDALSESPTRQPSDPRSNQTPVSDPH